MSIDAERRIKFDGCFNFRDLGGYVTESGRTLQWGRLFRADGLQRLTDDDRRRFAELGIVTVIDLRTPDEIERRGRFEPDVNSTRYHHLPLVDVIPDMTGFDADAIASPDFMVDRYEEMLADGAERIATALTVLAEPGALPAVFHCAAGKDRTGLLAAIILRLLGVPASDVIADYAMSQVAMREMIAWVKATSPEASEAFEKYPAPMTAADPDNMVRLLARLEKNYGSMAGYVTSLGVNPDVVARLKAALL
jgi:protein-tyrosine phosphatase